MSQQIQFDWIPLPPLKIEGKRAESINRRIETHIKFRADVEAGSFPGNRFKRPQDGLLEALRRELFIRRDTILLMREKDLDTASEEVLVDALLLQLKGVT